MGQLKLPSAYREIFLELYHLIQHLTLIDISQGKRLEFVPGVVDKASTHFGQIRTEVKKAKLTSSAEKTFDILQLEQNLDKIDAEEIKQLGDTTQGYVVKKLSRPYLIAINVCEFIQTDITYNVII